MNKKNPKLVLILWEDHTADSSWVTMQDILDDGPAIIESVGWLVHETRKQITLVSARVKNHDEDFGGTQLILKKNIVERFEIEIKD